MKPAEELIAIHSEVLFGGDILVTFSDARCVVYPSHLLRSMMPTAEQFVDTDLLSTLRIDSN